MFSIFLETTPRAPSRAARFPQNVRKADGCWRSALCAVGQVHLPPERNPA